MELSIFKTILTYTSKLNIPIFEKLKRKWKWIIFYIFGLFKPWWQYIYIKFERQINEATHFFKKHSYKHKNQCLNNVHVIHLRFTNANTQFIFNPCASTTYCTSYMTKMNKPIISKQHSIIKKWIESTRDANSKIQKLINTFKNIQQMVINLVFFLPLYHSSQKIQFHYVVDNMHLAWCTWHDPNIKKINNLINLKLKTSHP